MPTFSLTGDLYRTAPELQSGMAEPQGAARSAGKETRQFLAWTALVFAFGASGQAFGIDPAADYPDEEPATVVAIYDAVYD